MIGCEDYGRQPLSDDPTPEFEFDVALSFAGEDRAYVEEVAQHLVDCELRVFYDEFFKSELWGKDLFQHLASIYRDRARYCLVFVSEAYAKKVWPKHELRQVQDRALFSKSEYLLPVILDDVDLPGLNRTTGHLDGRKHHPAFVSGMVMQKLGIFDHEPIDRSEVTRRKNLRTNKPFVKFGGAPMINSWPSKIRSAQALRHVSYEATILRIPYGEEMRPRFRMRDNCPNCAVRKGQVHVPGCTHEICPLCGGQLCACECPIGEYTSKPFEALLLTGKKLDPEPPEPIKKDTYLSRVEYAKRFGRRVPRAH